MSMPVATTLVVAPEALAREQLALEGEAFHHLIRVKRLEVGDRLRLVDGRGHARFAELTAVAKRDASARVGAEAPPNEPALEVELLVGAPKPERAAWLVEKATEVGVAAIRFVATERAARSVGAAQVERLRRVAVAAVEQCGRARVPDVSTEPSLAAALERLTRDDTPWIVLDFAGTRPFSGALLSPPPTHASGIARDTLTRVAVLIGPEGGWSDAERVRFAALGAPVWSLGERALRVETAAMVAAGLLLAGVLSR